MLATLHDGLLISGLAALMLVGSATPIVWARWVLRGSARSRTVAIALTGGLSIGILIGGLAVWLPLIAAVVAVAIAARLYLPRAGRIAAAVLIVVAGLPLWAFTALYVMIAVAMYGCGPEAEECPF
jgi:hypothetical protein